MDPKWQFLFYLIAIVLWLIAAFWPLRTASARTMSSSQLQLIGWVCFAIPFAWTAATTGW